MPAPALEQALPSSVPGRVREQEPEQLELAQVREQVLVPGRDQEQVQLALAQVRPGPV